MKNQATKKHADKHSLDSEDDFRQSPTTVLFRTTLTRTITAYQLLILLGSNHVLQGSKKPPSGRPGQVDSPFGQVTFSPSLPNEQGHGQAVRRLNF